MSIERMQKYWDSDEWAKMKVDLLQVSRAKCEYCGKTTNALVPHHLTYKNYKQEEPEDIVLICHKCHAIEHGKIKVKPKRMTRKERIKARKEKKAILKLLPKKKKPTTYGGVVKRVCPLCNKYLSLNKGLYICECGYNKPSSAKRTIREEQAGQLKKTLIGILNGKI